MKLLEIISIVALAGCGQPHQPEVNAIERQAADVISLDRDVERTTFPDWLTQLYPSEIRFKYQVISQELTVFHNVNDSVSYCIYRQMDGTCTRHFVQTFADNSPKERLEIGHNCDHDLSIPEYKWKEFEIESLTNILTVEYKESVHDSLITADGWLKEKYRFLEVETVVDTTRQTFQVDERGRIKEMFE